LLALPPDQVPPDWRIYAQQRWDILNPPTPTETMTLTPVPTPTITPTPTPTQENLPTETLNN